MSPKNLVQKHLGPTIFFFFEYVLEEHFGPKLIRTKNVSRTNVSWTNIIFTVESETICKRFLWFEAWSGWYCITDTNTNTRVAVPTGYLRLKAGLASWETVENPKRLLNLILLGFLPKRLRNYSAGKEYNFHSTDDWEPSKKPHCSSWILTKKIYNCNKYEISLPIVDIFVTMLALTSLVIMSNVGVAK